MEAYDFENAKIGFVHIDDYDEDGGAIIDFDDAADILPPKLNERFRKLFQAMIEGHKTDLLDELATL